MDVSFLKAEFIDAANIGPRELVVSIERALEYSYIDDFCICNILLSDPIFAQRDIVIYADLMFLLGRRDVAMREYEKWLVAKPEVGGPASDLIPFARTCHYANERLRARIFQVSREPLPEDLIGRLIVRSASASLGDWQSCIFCHSTDLGEEAVEVMPVIKLRMTGLSVLAHYNMILYKDAAVIASSLIEAAPFSIIDSRLKNLDDVIETVMQRSELFENIMQACAAREAATDKPNAKKTAPPVDLNRIDIFIKTYPGDQAWLEWCLKSIKKFARGFRRVVIVSDAGHNFKDVILHNSTYIEIPKPPTSAPFGVTPGYLTQQIAKLNWHHYTDADAVMMLDSDSILRREIRPQQMVCCGQPIWWFTSWGPNRAQRWRPGSEIVIGRNVPFSYMTEQPYFLSRSATEAFHAHVQRRFGRSIGDIYFDDNIPAIISEFECFGAYLGCIDNCGYLLKDFTAPKGFVDQYWSWGGIGEEEDIRLKTLLNGNV